jgi:ribosome biogenesis protein ERB1
MARKKAVAKTNTSSSKPEMKEEPSLGRDEDDTVNSDDSSVSVYDSGVEEYEEEEYDSDAVNDGADDDDDDDDDQDSEDGFEDQGSSDDEDDILEDQKKQATNDDDDESQDELELVEEFETVPRAFAKMKSIKRDQDGKIVKGNDGDDIIDDPEVAKLVHTDDLSSDDEDGEGTGNRIGRVPLHWYDEYDHIGYDGHGGKVVKQAARGEGGDLLDQALKNEADLANKRYTVYDALNDKDVQLTDRQLELIRRVQGGAFAHPEHNAHPDYVDYFSGVDRQISGLNSNRYEPKARFQPSKFEKLLVKRMLHKLEKGDITMDYLTGKVKDMNDVKRKVKKDGENDKPFMMWKGDEEDELNIRKGPQHIAAPKLPPPTHAESYNPPEEYLPTEEDLKEWEEMEIKDRPHGLLVPKKFPNLRSVGAYEYAVRERFERCLDLYLCPRVMKRRLNIDPESLVPSLPKASDLRPFPTSKCIEYNTPYDEEAPMIRCLSVSPDGQFFASGASDGYVRLWETQTGRLLKSWNLSKLINSGSSDDEKEEEAGVCEPVMALEWNPNRSHHCLLAAVENCAVVIATGTGGPGDAELTDALFAASASCKGGVQAMRNAKVAKVVTWKAAANEFVGNTQPISAFSGTGGPIVTLTTTRTITCVKWHKKGDYFVTVSPKAGPAAVLIHQLSKANSQQPFSKNKGEETQCACFHPTKPFLFVASKQYIRVYHLVKQAMVKRKLLPL